MKRMRIISFATVCVMLLATFAFAIPAFADDDAFVAESVERISATEFKVVFSHDVAEECLTISKHAFVGIRYCQKNDAGVRGFDGKGSLTVGETTYGRTVAVNPENGLRYLDESHKNILVFTFKSEDVGSINQMLAADNPCRSQDGKTYVPAIYIQERSNTDHGHLETMKDTSGNLLVSTRSSNNDNDWENLGLELPASEMWEIKGDDIDAPNTADTSLMFAGVAATAVLLGGAVLLLRKKETV